MILPLTIFAQLAAVCGFSVNVDTLASIARTESHFNTFAIGDNTTRRFYAPVAVEQAVATATALINRGHSIDLGLMQINSANLRGLALSVADTFDTCKNIAGGARILAAGYRPNVGEDTQPALLRALSRYNTGNDQAGFTNGYVQRVQLAAQEVVPAIHLSGSAAVGPGGGEGAGVAAPSAPPVPPSWDVYAQARYWHKPPPASAAPAMPTAPLGQAPVVLQQAGSLGRQK